MRVCCHYRVCFISPLVVLWKFPPHVCWKHTADVFLSYVCVIDVETRSIFLSKGFYSWNPSASNCVLPPCISCATSQVWYWVKLLINTLRVCHSLKLHGGLKLELFYAVSGKITVANMTFFLCDHNTTEVLFILSGKDLSHLLLVIWDKFNSLHHAKGAAALFHSAIASHMPSIWTFHQ